MPNEAKMPMTREAAQKGLEAHLLTAVAEFTRLTGRRVITAMIVGTLHPAGPDKNTVRITYTAKARVE